jgi:AhpD family alkylhydroperoxidase
MEPRLATNEVVPDIVKAMYGLEAAVRRHVPRPLLELVKLRASQVNGCAYCVDMHAFDAKAGGETDERLWSLVTWRESPLFTDEERAALALTEAATRLADATDAVPDDVWAEAARHFDDEALGALVMAIATINAWNRIGVATRPVPGSHRVAAA